MKNFALPVIVCFGCGSNADVDLGIGITDRGTQLSVVVDLVVHGAPIAAPLDDASAVLRVRDQRIPLVAARGGLSASFTLTPLAATDEMFEVDVTRDGETANLELQAPPAFELTAPFPTFVPRSQDLTIAWTTASDDPMYWTIDDSECLAGVSGDIEVGNTQLTIPASMFAGRDSFEHPTCGSEFYLRRYRVSSDASSGFAATHLSYQRESDAPFASTP